MGFLDDLKANMSDMSHEVRARFEELKNRESEGDMNDHDRAELQQLRERYEQGDAP